MRTKSGRNARIFPAELLLWHSRQKRFDIPTLRFRVPCFRESRIKFKGSYR